jgi:RNA polymerase sigma factor (sigma-70 family)
VDFAALFDRYYNPICGYLRRRVEPAIADEIAAQTFLEAYDRRASFDPLRGEPRAWLYGIAINLLRHHRRAEERRLRAYARAGVPHRRDENDDADERVDARAAAPAVAAALATLSPSDREVLLLFAWAELSYEEIAMAVGIPVGTVRSRLNRARCRVRACLDADPIPDAIRGA